MNINDYCGPPLEELLTYRRAHNSLGEREYIRKFIMPYSPQILVDDTTDQPMAFLVRVGNPDIMFTSHTDTVHMTLKDTSITRQEVFFEKNYYHKNDNQPLGADDAAGNWIMFNMIEAKVPGLYAFFRGEERGGIGSSWCAKTLPYLFEQIKAAIAFDRRGTRDIITHQGNIRGCSDEFAHSLSRILKLGHQPCDAGVYTDTKEFFGLITNCTNMSVGYFDEHTKKERLFEPYLYLLRDAVIEANWSALDHIPPRADPIIHPPYSSRTSSLFGNVTFDDDEVEPLDIADFLMDHCDKLPRDLRDNALELSQDIYKRYE